MNGDPESLLGRHRRSSAFIGGPTLSAADFPHSRKLCCTIYKNMRSARIETSRRGFLRALAAASAVAPLVSAQPKRQLRIGHTGITWGFKPDDAPGAIREVASLGYRGYETFGEYLDAWELKGGMKALLDE